MARAFVALTLVMGLWTWSMITMVSSIPTAPPATHLVEGGGY
jgi:hypothetical protein